MSGTEFRRNDYVDSLRLSEDDEIEILADLARETTMRNGRDRRHQSRVPYQRRAGLMVQMHHPGGTIANYLVRVRDLSSGGMGFLHGSFVYSGTRCAVILLTNDKKAIRVDGVVVRCSHVRKHIHQIGLHFDAPICLRDFVAGSLLPLGEDLQTSKELPHLAGTVMYVEDSVSDQELLTFHLLNVGVKVKAVSNVLAAVELASQTKFDAVLANIWLPAMSGLDLADFLRQSGYKGPIIALTADDREEVSRDAMSHGCTAVLVKPYAIDNLIGLLQPHLPQNGDADPGHVLLSSLWGDERMQPLIRTFLGRLKDEVAEMDRLVKSGKGGAGLRKLCLDVKGSAGGYGFQQVSEAAQEILELLLAEADAERIKTAFSGLAGMARSACLVNDEDQKAAGAGGPRTAAEAA
ncbi:MAG: response regulator [Tepidisphaeraceae bacterium]|jgi:CheY-like chemotaxis protein